MDEVLEQSIAAGNLVPIGSTITLVIASETVDVPIEFSTYLGEFRVKTILFTDNTCSFSPENVIESIVRAEKYSVSGILPATAKIHGFWAEFYFPRENRKSAYGHLSDDQGYLRNPDKRRRVTVVGAILDRMFSGDNLDNYFGPPPTIYVLGDESHMPENTKIRVLFGRDKFVEFQVDRCDVVYGMDEALITKIILLPVSAQH